MILEIILGLVIGNVAAKSRKVAFIVGAVVGFVLGFLVAPWYMSMRGESAGIGFTIIVAVVEAVIIGLISLGVASAKIRKRAKKLSDETIEKTLE